MTGIEIALSIAAVLASCGVSWWALRLSHRAGADMQRDPERVRRFVAETLKGKR